MDPQRKLAGTHSLFPPAKEEGNIRGIGPDIQRHETAAGLLRRAETEISSQSRAVRKKGYGRSMDRERETAFL